MPPVSHVKYAFLAAIAASATLSSSVFAQRPKNPPPDDCPNDNPECKCPTDDAVENGCVLISLDLGRTTPWTGSDSVKLKIRTTKASPSLSTPSQLKLVLGYSFMYVGSDQTAAGAPRFVFFAQSAGRTLSFQFADGSSVGVPSPGMYGESKTRLQMVDAEGWATLANPAYYDLYPGDGSVYRFSASPAAPDFGNLVHRIDPRGVLSTWEDMGVMALRDASGNIRQVATRTRLADVQTLSDTHYTVTVYPLDAEPDTDPDTGLFVLPQWDPTRVLDVSQGSSPLELLVGFQKGTGDMRQYRYVEQNGEWTLVKPSGLVDSKEIFYSADEMGARRLHLIRSPEGELLRRTEMNFASTPWGWAMTNRIEGIPGDATRTTSWSFYEDGPNRGEIREKITPTGNRILYEYDDKNRVVRESMPLVEEETLYSYEPVDSSDPPLLCDTRPRCVVRKMQGIEIQRTYYVYGTNGVDVVERVGEQGAAYGGTNVLRTVTTYYPVTGAITDGLVQSVRHEDGTIDNYAYDLSDGIWTETVTHVHEQAPDIVPMRTTRSVRVFNALGQLVDSRTDLCTIGVEDLVPQADWTPIERLQYAYDIDGNEIRREDLAGRLWTAEWAGNCCGKVSETDWQGITTVYSYDDEGRLIAIAVTQPTPLVTIFAYDWIGNLVASYATNMVDAIGIPATRHQYDSLGRLVFKMDQQFNQVHFRYLDNENRISTVFTTGLSEFRTFDVIERLVEESNSAGWKHSIEYGVTSNGVIWQKDLFWENQNNWRWTKIYFDMFERIICEEQSDNSGSTHVKGIAYDSFNRSQSETSYSLSSDNQRADESSTITQFDRDGSTLFVALDVNGNGAIDFEGEDEIRGYHKFFCVTNSMIWRQQEVLEFPIFFSSNCVVSETERECLSESGFHFGMIEKSNQNGERTVEKSFWDRNAGIRGVAICDSNSHVIERAVYQYGRLTETVLNGGSTNRFDYDGLGRRIRTTNERGTVLGYSFSDRNLVTNIVRNGTVFRSYRYDPFGRVEEVSDADGVLQQFAYDERNNLVGKMERNGGMRFAYDENDRMVSMSPLGADGTIQRAKTIQWSYSLETGRLQKKTFPDGSFIGWKFGAEGHLIAKTKESGTTILFTYDSARRLIRIEYDDNTPDVTIRYDRLGRISQIYDENGLTNSFTYVGVMKKPTIEIQNGYRLIRSYDGEGRCTKLEVPALFTTSYKYASGSAVSEIHSSAFGQGDEICFQYSSETGLMSPTAMTCSGGFGWQKSIEQNSGLVSSVEYFLQSEPIVREAYRRNQWDRIVEKNNWNGLLNVTNHIDILYARSGELKAAVESTERYDYEFDCFGNRLVRVFNSETNRFEANDLNQLFQREPFVSDNQYCYDLNGNLVSDVSGFHYTWDANNRMISASNTIWRIGFIYDYRNRIVEKIVNDMVSSRETIYRFLWDENNIVAEIIEQPGTTNVCVNVWGLDIEGSLSESGGVGALLCVRTDNNVFYPIHDSLGNISSYVSTNGGIVAHFKYGPFGELVSEEGDLADMFPFRYASKHWCPYTKLVEFERRRYSPILGRFLSRDPMGELKNMNLYAYAVNDPVNRWDYLGLIDESDLDDVQNIEDIQRQCDDFIRSRDGEGGWIIIPDGRLSLSTAGKTNCENEYHRILADTNIEKLQSLIQQRKMYPHTCDHLELQCKCCDYQMNVGTGRPRGVSGSYSNNRNKPQLTLCWNSIKIKRKNGKNDLTEVITHEMTHFLQHCSGFGPNKRTCEDSLKREIEARKCAGQCKSFGECFERSLGSSCKGNKGFCSQGIMARESYETVKDWFKNKHNGIPTEFCDFVPEPPIPNP